MGTHTTHGLTSGAAGSRVSRPPARRKAVYAAPDPEPMPAPMPVPVPAVTHGEIARRAYEIYEARGAHDSDALGDWLAAERELCLRTGAPAATPGPTGRDVYH